MGCTWIRFGAVELGFPPPADVLVRGNLYSSEKKRLDFKVRV